MKTIRLAAATSLLILLATPLARADEPLPPPLVFVRTFLQLTDDQTAALIGMIRTRDAAMQPIAANVQASQEALGKLLDSPSADATAAGSLLLDIHAGQKQLAAIAQSAAASFEALLSQEQRDRLQFVRQAAQAEPAIPAFKAVGLM